MITPYAEQVRLIQEKLKPIAENFNHVEIGHEDIASVNSFQGSERDVIIMSFVRSPRNGQRCGGKGVKENKNGRFDCHHCRGKGFEGSGLRFVLDLRMLNVGFTRARKMLILVGDINALTDRRKAENLAGGKVLADFRSYIDQHGKVLHVWERESFIDETE